jgi:hypothetical protein
LSGSWILRGGPSCPSGGLALTAAPYVKVRVVVYRCGAVLTRISGCRRVLGGRPAVDDGAVAGGQQVACEDGEEGAAKSKAGRREEGLGVGSSGAHDFCCFFMAWMSVRVLPIPRLFLKKIKVGALLIHFLLYTYFNRKLNIHINPQDLEILPLIEEKRKIRNYSPLSL